MAEAAAITKFAECLKDRGSTLYIPEEAIEAYKYGALALDLSDVEMAFSGDCSPEEKLFEAVREASRLRKQGRQAADLPPSKKNFVPTLQSDFTNEGWGIVDEHFQLEERETAMISFPDGAAAEVIRFCLIFSSCWRPSAGSDKLCVLSTNKSVVVSGPKLLEDFGLENRDKHFGAVVVCKRFYTSEALRLLVEEIEKSMKRASSPAIIEIADVLHITP